MAEIAITTRAAAEERPTEWEAFGGAPCRAARLDCSRRCEATATAAQNRPQRIRRSAREGAIWAATIALAPRPAAWGRGRRGAMVVAFREAFGNKDEGVILGVIETETT